MRAVAVIRPEGKALKEAYQWEARAQWNGKPLTGDIEVSITLYFGTKRRADLDNFNKLSLDALSRICRNAPVDARLQEPKSAQRTITSNDPPRGAGD
jgi:Holliday junction resolvase RusA-like endonuclease